MEPSFLRRFLQGSVARKKSEKGGIYLASEGEERIKGGFSSDRGGSKGSETKRGRRSEQIESENFNNNQERRGEWTFRRSLISKLESACEWCPSKVAAPELFMTRDRCREGSTAIRGGFLRTEKFLRKLHPLEQIGGPS